MNIMKLTLAALSIGAASIGVSAHAATISGDVEISGLVTEASVGDMNGVDFDGNGFVIGGIGDFAGYAGTPVTLSDISFATPGAIWAFDQFQFVADSFSGLMANGQGGKDFTATGTLTGTSFDPTPGVFNFSSQKGQGLASFSSSSFPTPVPVPAALPLLLVGLGGLGFVARKKKSEA